MKFEFSGKIWYWKGPSPWYFVTVPPKECDDIKEIANQVTYGWGMIPVKLRIGQTEWKSSLFAKDDSYVVPLKTAVRHAEKVAEGDEVTINLEVL